MRGTLITMAVTDSTAKSPSHVYSSAGSYTVNLTVTNRAGSDSEVKTGYITVTAAPVAPIAAFTNVTPRTGTALLTVTFTDQSTNTPTSWNWEYKTGAGRWIVFGSGARTPSHTFAAGTYDIRLTVTNAGGTDSELKTGYITARASTSPPIADFSTNVTSGTPPLAVKFMDMSTGTGISAWIWDFNNDRIIDSTSQNPSYVYTSPGTYTVLLNVTNAGGFNTTIKSGYIKVSNVMMTKIGIFNGGNWYIDFNGDGQFIPSTGDRYIPYGATGGHNLSETGMETGRARSGSSRTVSGTSITAEVA